ncbi:secretion protein EccK [Mycolicibacterium mageritense]|uniref:secretion protein EccK n=1 Tax=Mycolicibacterium mageritense TaxID=53462 RepID=UPI0011D815DB|nr:secretion protein EccK [Mycolicibacterium mageritense]TXI60486.1 MAG: secretion protein EccK [Mycolicibacterium mageritense]
MPVSAARLERDAVIAATSGGSSRGKSHDALTVARRIAAALNAIQVADFGFFWMTAVAADDTIVVANSYGIGYIPEVVNLPAQVKFANIDESIPPADRGKWTSYPLLMLQGWAQHHNNPLKQVIATEEQFKGSDPGVAKIVLQPDDIPTVGTMQGRSRLEVVAPHAAERLSATSDFTLTELLPPAPADSSPPEEDQFMKWFSVMQPLMSEMDGRVAAHLKAFVDYAEYAQAQALHTAYTATDSAVQRSAIADWVYWQHLSVLMSDALQAGVTV